MITPASVSWFFCVVMFLIALTASFNRIWSSHGPKPERPQPLDR